MNKLEFIKKTLQKIVNDRNLDPHWIKLSEQYLKYLYYISVFKVTKSNIYYISDRKNCADVKIGDWVVEQDWGLSYPFNEVTRRLIQAICSKSKLLKDDYETGMITLCYIQELQATLQQKESITAVWELTSISGKCILCNKTQIMASAHILNSIDSEDEVEIIFTCYHCYKENILRLSKSELSERLKRTTNL